MSAGRGGRMVIGIGNPSRRDDGVGVLVAQRLAPRAPRGVDVRTCAGGGLELIEAWEGAELAVVVDAVASGAPPGTVHRLDAGARPLPARLRGAGSTHDLGLRETVELARAVERLPPRLLVIGIEGADFSHGPALSPPVQEAVERASAAVLAGLAERPGDAHAGACRPHGVPGDAAGGQPPDRHA